MTTQARRSPRRKKPPPIAVVPFGAEDTDAWVSLRRGLFPQDSAAAHRREIAALLASEREAGFGAVSGNSRWLGLIELRERDYAEGCLSSPVPYIEALWVAPKARRNGVARLLVEEAIAWARERGHSELASDTGLGNLASQVAHRRLGFQETERLVCFRMDLAKRRRTGRKKAAAPRP
ncbi:MAG: GNAT family N-acetyltransferase [Bauldia sp.]